MSKRDKRVDANKISLAQYVASKEPDYTMLDLEVRMQELVEFIIQANEVKRSA